VLRCVGDLARRVWSDYYVGADAIVFLVDSADRERFPEARRELDVCIAIARSLSLSLSKGLTGQAMSLALTQRFSIHCCHNHLRACFIVFAFMR
jgi:hypothetical protein